MNALLALFKSLDLVRIGVWLLVGAALGGSVWFHGYVKGSVKLDQYKAAQATETARVIVKQGEVTTRVVTEYVRVKGDTEIVYRDVLKEVERYVQANPDGAVIDADWVRLHNAAARNQSSRPRPGADGGLRAPRADNGYSLGFRSAANGDGELREASRLRGSAELFAAVGPQSAGSEMNCPRDSGGCYGGH